MATRLTVSNLALSKLGEARQLTDPLEDTQAARSIAAVWDDVRRATLRKGKFNFSMTRAQLTAQAATDPYYLTPYPFSNRFPVPGDCLRLVEVLGPADVISCYKYERRAVLANSDGPVYVRYVADVADPGTWDDLFARAMAARLAFEIAEAITGDRGRKGDCLTDFRLAIAEAGGTDAKEDPPEEPYESDWVTARLIAPLGGPSNV